MSHSGSIFDSFVESKVKEGRYGSTSETIRAGLRLLEERESKLDQIRQVLAKGEEQLDSAQGIDGDTFTYELIGG